MRLQLLNEDGSYGWCNNAPTRERVNGAAKWYSIVAIHSAATKGLQLHKWRIFSRKITYLEVSRWATFTAFVTLSRVSV